MRLNDFKISLFWQGVIIFCLSLFIFSLAQFPNTFLDPDAFYHAKISEKIAQQGIITDFPWLQYSTLKDNFVDHHLGFHLLVAPFTKILDKAFALKFANLLINSAFVTLFYVFLKKQKIKLASLFTFFIFFATPLYGRLSANKASGLALLLVLLFIWSLFLNKKWALFIISALYLWCYGGWPILLIILFAYFISKLLFSAIEKKAYITKDLLLQIVTPILGIIFAFIINPYFPKNIYFYWQQIIQIGLVNLGDKIKVGAEWYPYDFFNLLTYTFFIWGMFIVALLLVVYQKTQAKWKHFFWIFLSMIFLAATLKSARYIEYFIPFFILATAYLLKDHKLIKPKNKYPKRIIAFFGFSLIFIITLMIYNFTNAVKSFYITHSTQEFSQASAWLKENTLPQSIIFHTSWDEFPQLWFHNDQNYYLGGLDPTFNYNFNQDLYLKWENIAYGREIENIYPIIKNEFKADYVFIEKNHHQKFLENMQNNFFAEKVYDDEESAIFYLKDKDYD